MRAFKFSLCLIPIPVKFQCIFLRENQGKILASEMEVAQPPKLLTLLKLLSVLSLPSLLWLLFCLHPFQCLHCSYCLDAVSAYTASIATLLTLLSLHKHCVQSAFQHILQHVKITQVILLCGLWIYGLWSGWIPLRRLRLTNRGGIWLHSQLPSARVYGDYQLIIAINSSILVNNRTRSAAECHL